MHTFSSSAIRATRESPGRHGIIEDSRDFRQAVRVAGMTRSRGLACLQLAKAVPARERRHRSRSDRRLPGPCGGGRPDEEILRPEHGTRSRGTTRVYERRKEPP